MTNFFADEAELHEQATKITGLEDFGDQTYREGLQTLLGSLEESAPHIESMRGFAAGLIGGVLASRLRAEQGWKKFPQARKQPIRAPLIVVGIPRSGTTALQQLLALDPQFQSMEQWLTTYPKPRPPRQTWEGDADYQAEVATLAFVDQAVPEMAAMHHVEAGDASECLIPMAQSFCSNYFGSTLSVPAYDEWFLAQDQTTSFRRYADFMRLIGYGDERTWLLKNPSNILAIDALLEVFPDARIVQTHRDPIQAVTSTCSLLMGARKMGGDPDIDGLRRYVAKRETHIYATGIERIMKSRARAEGRILDIDFRAFNTEPLVQVQSIYQHFDLELRPQVRAAMQDWLDNNPPGKHGAHRYAPNDFGFDADRLRERFADYIRAFNL